LRHRRASAAATTAEQAQHGQRVDAEDPPGDQCDRHRTEADSAAAAEGETAATTRAARILDIRTLVLAIHSHA
jgi:hypothetical protein